MEIYYKGNLLQNDLNIDVENQSKFMAVYKAYAHPNSLDEFQNQLNNLDYDKLKTYIKRFCNESFEIKSQDIINILNKVKVCRKMPACNFKVIFSLIEDEDGRVYGKELITGLLFPIAKNPIIKYYYGKDWCLQKRFTYTNDNMARFKYILLCEEVASINDINKYKKDESTKITTIKDRYNENVFKEQVVEKKKEMLERQNELTKLMEDIEYLLAILKKANVELYNKHIDEYNNLIKSQNNSVYCEPSKEDFIYLLSSIKLALYMNEKGCDNIIDYLNNIIIEYFERMMKNEITVKDLNIDDLDRLTTYILKNKDSIDISTQRTILSKISLLYLLIIKNNSDNITKELLEKTYFKDNLKSIILNINALKECDIITNEIGFNLQTNLTVENVFNMIKEIKLNTPQQQNVKKLIS